MKMSDCLKSSRRNIKEMFNRFSDSSTSDNSGQIRVKPKCPQCSENKDNDGSDEGAIEMDFIFMLRLLLYDGAAWLTANIWKAEAVTFLKDITPNDVLSSPKHKADVNAMLSELCPLDKPLNEKPWLDLCLKSYTVGGVVNYQIFDTCIV